MSKNVIHKEQKTSYSLFNKAHFGKTPKLTVVFLLCMLVLSSTHVTQASSTTTESASDVTPVNPVLLTDELVEETSVQTVDDEFDAEISTSEESESELQNKNESSSSAPITEDINNKERLDEEPASTTNDQTDVIEVITSTTTVIENPPATTTSASTSAIGEDDTFSQVSNISSTTSPVSEDQTDFDTATTTDTNEDQIEVVSPLEHLSQSDSEVVFNRDNCVMVGQGNFYCQDGTNAETDRPDGVYAYPDKDGDLEIFIQRSGELEQITHNLVDDASPWFDPITDTIVWHRLIEGRYQIIDYDVKSQTEQQLTVGATNNMEPTKQGRYTAWQAWLDNNWEIVLHDGNDIYRLTHSAEPDVAPQIRNGLLLWYRIQANGDRMLELYNIATKERVSIKDDGEGVISNPRMMVVFESQTDNGDTVVKGYDMVTGEVVPISSHSQPSPTDIPNPNPTGEPTALFSPNNKLDITDEEQDGPEDDMSDDGNQTGSDTLLDNDFDDDSTLVLFDYGVATSSNEDEKLSNDTMAEADYTIDMRTEDSLEELTLEIPLYSDDSSTSSETTLSSQD